MNLYERIRLIDGRWRVILIALALLLVAQVGQFVSLSSLNATSHDSPLALLFLFLAIFLIPTGFILTSVILWSLRRDAGRHIGLIALGTLNLILVVSLTWYFFGPCSWAHVFGLSVRYCHKS